MDTITIKGKYTDAVVYGVGNSDYNSEQYALAQIKQLCDLEATAKTIIRVMPDFHPGQGCVIGLTMQLADKIMPNLVGTDIGCGVAAYQIKKFRADFQKLDKVILNNAISGHNVHKKKILDPGNLAWLEALLAKKHINFDIAIKSLGTLGSGNHFIEIGQGGDESVWLIIHTGSRHLGRQICDWYLKLGAEKLKAAHITVPYELTWISDDLAENYLHDLKLTSRYAALNRDLIAKTIFNGMGWKMGEKIESRHNYISPDYILRKGAIEAQDPCIIPINMRDGIILGHGKRNISWNNSAPHGAGRIFSRSQVQERFTLKDFKKTMQGIYSSCLNTSLDEGPFAYRSLEAIAHAIKDIVEIEMILSPLYNFKG